MLPDGGDFRSEVVTKLVEGVDLYGIDDGREGGDEVGVAFDRWWCGWLVVASLVVATATAAAFDGRRGRNSVRRDTILWPNEEFRWRIKGHACQWWPSCVVES